MESNEKLKSFLEQLYGYSINEKELKEYKERIVDVFSLLIEVDKRNKKGK